MRDRVSILMREEDVDRAGGDVRDEYWDKQRDDKERDNQANRGGRADSSSAALVVGQHPDEGRGRGQGRGDARDKYWDEERDDKERNDQANGGGGVDSLLGTSAPTAGL